MRFNDLARQLGGASKKMAQQLDEMEATGLVERRVLSTRPVAIAYEITAFRTTALDFLARLKGWAEAQGV